MLQAPVIGLVLRCCRDVDRLCVPTLGDSVWVCKLGLQGSPLPGDAESREVRWTETTVSLCAFQGCCVTQRLELRGQTGKALFKPFPGNYFFNPTKGSWN